MRVVLAILVAGLFLPAVAAQAPPTDIRDQIEKAWKAREDRVRTADIQIQMTATWFKGGMTFSPASGIPKVKIVPPEDTRTTAKLRFVLDGLKCRVEQAGTLWNGTEFRDDVMQTTLMNKDICKRLEFGRLPVPRGSIDNKDTYFFARMDDYRPLLYWARSLHPAMRSFRIDDLKSSGVTSVIAGRVCRQLILAREASDRDEYWVDPGRDWVVVREVYVPPNGRGTQLDIEYQPDSSGGWIPKVWTFRNNLAADRPVSVQQYTVTGYSVNAPIAHEDFEITFPPGTEVIDSRLQGPERYFTVTSETPQRLDPAPSRLVWVYVAVTVFCSLLVIVVAYRKRRSWPSPAV